MVYYHKLGVKTESQISGMISIRLMEDFTPIKLIEFDGVDHIVVIATKGASIKYVRLLPTLNPPPSPLMYITEPSPL